MTSAGFQTPDVDITPHPRILRMLGEISFEPHKCVGELIDNAIDGYLRAPRLFIDTFPTETPQITVLVPHRDRLNSGSGEVMVEDNGPGMGLCDLINAARAGYSGNSPIENLGLFGMGFNIATARLGGVTELRSGVAKENTWSVLEIDLSQLQHQGNFAIRPRFENKSPLDHGTRITIRQLKPEQAIAIAAGVRGGGRRSVTGLRQWIGRTYTKYLRDSDPRLGNKPLKITVNGEAITPYQWCVWGSDKYVEVGAVTRQGPPEKINARREFDEVLGGGSYCVDCLSWQPDESQMSAPCSYCHGTNIVERVRRLKGWIGVQRHLDDDEYGFDFIRNGRAILQWDKRAFSWTDPDTGRTELEYPIDELRASHGRIVGEIEIDHVPVHYQKDSFEEESRLWKEVIDRIRGRSPLRAHVAERRGLPRNESLLQPIYRGYNRTRTEEGGRFGQGIRRRREPWSRDLIINQDTARSYYEKFQQGDPDYQSDDKWYEWLIDADAVLARQDQGASTDSGSSNDLPAVIAPPNRPQPSTRTERQRLIEKAEADSSLSGTYGFEPHRVLEVNVYRIGENLFREHGSVSHAVPLLVLPELQGSVDCFYDETHPRIMHDEADIRELVVAEAALVLRERYYDRLPYSWVLDHLKKTRLPDLSRDTLGKSAVRLISDLAPRFARAFASYEGKDSRELRGFLRDEDVRQLGREVAGHGGGQSQVEALLETGEFLKLMPLVMSRILREVPERFLDDYLFALPYSNLPQGLSETERFELAWKNVSRIANPLEDVANATKFSLFEPVAVERLARLRAFRSIDLVREFLVET